MMMRLTFGANKDPFNEYNLNLNGSLLLYGAFERGRYQESLEVCAVVGRQTQAQITKERVSPQTCL